jgi:anti-anti-sigma factor
MGSPGTPRFGIDESYDDGVLVLAVSGELDLATAPQLQEKITAAREAGEGVRLDLRPLTFIDSSGLRVLLGRPSTRATRRRGASRSCRARVPSTGSSTARACAS